ncbi:MAG: hypothetical protein HYV47_02295 [Candidatus Nealsonbacteria bacterium]|nr:hypothetical protein [Candidatus Nealsonbacteria bacterium]
MRKRFLALLLSMISMILIIACAPRFVEPQTVYIKMPGTERKLQAKAYADKRALQKYRLLNFKVEITNTSSQTLEKAELTFSIYNKEGVVVERGVDGLYYLSAGDTATVNSWISSAESNQKISKYEFSFKEMEWGSDSTPYSINNFLENPLSPGEVLAAYFLFTAQINYERMKDLVSYALQGQLPDKIIWEVENAKPFASGFADILIMREYIHETYAKVNLVIYYKGGEETLPVTMYLILEDGMWKIGKRLVAGALF